MRYHRLIGVVVVAGLAALRLGLLVSYPGWVSWLGLLSLIVPSGGPPISVDVPSYWAVRWGAYCTIDIK